MKKILLIEDDEDSSVIIHKYLADAGYLVESLGEGRSIVERRFSRPDVFVLDNGLPTIDGIALCKYLKLQHDLRDIPVVIISGDHEIAWKAERAGAAVFLAKPFFGSTYAYHRCPVGSANNAGLFQAYAGSVNRAKLVHGPVLLSSAYFSSFRLSK